MLTIGDITKKHDKWLRMAASFGVPKSLVNDVVQQSEPLKCDQVCDWYSVGHQLNGHQECRTCGKQKAF